MNGARAVRRMRCTHGTHCTLQLCSLCCLSCTSDESLTGPAVLEYELIPRLGYELMIMP